MSYPLALVTDTLSAVEEAEVQVWPAVERNAYIALAHLILVRVQECQRAGELDIWIGRGKVVDLGAEVLVIEAIIKATRRESLGVSLEAVNLLYLTAIWKADIVDAKVRLIVITVRRDLAYDIVSGTNRFEKVLASLDYPSTER